MHTILLLISMVCCRQIILRVHVAHAHQISGLLNSFSSLGHLECLHLSIHEGHAEDAAIKLWEGAQLSQLSYLCLPSLHIPGDLLPAGAAASQGLTRLTGLTQLALGQLTTLPVSFAALQNLERLMLGHVTDGSYILPADLQQCTRLTYLQLKEWAMPAERAWQTLSAALQTLAALRCLVLKGMSFDPEVHRIHWRIPRQVTALSIAQSGNAMVRFPHDLVNHPSLELLELSMYMLDTLPVGPYLSKLQLQALRDVTGAHSRAGPDIELALHQAMNLRYLLMEEGPERQRYNALQRAKAGLKAQKAAGLPSFRIISMPHCIDQQDPHIELQGMDARLWPFRDFDWEARGMRSQNFQTSTVGGVCGRIGSLSSGVVVLPQAKAPMSGSQTCLSLRDSVCMQFERTDGQSSKSHL